MGDAIDKKELDKIIKFYEEYLGTHDKTTARLFIEAHLKYATIDYAVDEKGEVIGLCRWNISPDGKIAHIIDLAIDSKWRKKGLGKHFLVRALKIWKNVTHLEFKRGLRQDNRRRLVPVEAILKRNIF